MDKQDFSGRLGTIARQLLDEPDVEQTLRRAVDLAVENIDHHIYASISITARRGDVDTPASSDERALRADRLQYELGEGPCLEAMWENDTFQIDDLGIDRRYPQWSPRVLADTGIQSTLSFQLSTSHDAMGSLNLYSPQVKGFDADARAEGNIFAAQAAVTLKAVQKEQQMQSAVMIRAVIGQAQGILMERYSIDAERAFDVLRRVSQDTNTRLREVAEHLVSTRRTPGL